MECEIGELREWLWKEIESLDSCREDALEMGNEERVKELWGMKVAYQNVLERMERLNLY